MKKLFFLFLLFATPLLSIACDTAPENCPPEKPTPSLIHTAKTIAAGIVSLYAAGGSIGIALLLHEQCENHAKQKSKRYRYSLYALEGLFFLPLLSASTLLSAWSFQKLCNKINEECPWKKETLQRIIAGYFKSLKIAGKSVAAAVLTLAGGFGITYAYTRLEYAGGKKSNDYTRGQNGCIAFASCALAGATLWGIYKIGKSIKNDACPPSLDTKCFAFHSG